MTRFTRFPSTCLAVCIAFAAPAQASENASIVQSAQVSGSLVATPPGRAILVYLDYQRAEGAEQCLANSALMTAVEARLGRRVFTSRESADVTAQLTAQHDGAAFHIVMALVDRDGHALGTRRLESRAGHCSALDDSVVLVLSLAVDLAARASVSTEANRAEPALEPSEHAPLETELHIPRAASARGRGWTITPELGVAVGVGLQPSANLGLRLGGRFESSEFWRLGVAATWWSPERLGSEQGAQFSVQSLELEVCPWTREYRRVELSVCAEQLLARVSARSFGFDRSTPDESVLLAWGPSAVGTYRLGDALVMSAVGSLLVTSVARRYYYTEGEEVTLHRMRSVLSTFGLLAGWKW
jgi:hypothetical protein